MRRTMTSNCTEGNDTKEKYGKYGYSPILVTEIIHQGDKQTGTKKFSRAGSGLKNLTTGVSKVAREHAPSIPSTENYKK